MNELLVKELPKSYNDTNDFIADIKNKPILPSLDKIHYYLREVVKTQCRNTMSLTSTSPTTAFKENGCCAYIRSVAEDHYYRVKLSEINSFWTEENLRKYVRILNEIGFLNISIHDITKIYATFIISNDGLDTNLLQRPNLKLLSFQLLRFLNLEYTYADAAIKLCNNYDNYKQTLSSIDILYCCLYESMISSLFIDKHVTHNNTYSIFHVYSYNFTPTGIPQDTLNYILNLQKTGFYDNNIAFVKTNIKSSYLNISTPVIRKPKRITAENVKKCLNADSVYDYTTKNTFCLRTFSNMILDKIIRNYIYYVTINDNFQELITLTDLYEKSALFKTNLSGTNSSLSTEAQKILNSSNIAKLKDVTTVGNLIKTLVSGLFENKYHAKFFRLLFV